MNYDWCLAFVNHLNLAKGTSFRNKKAHQRDIHN